MRKREKTIPLTDPSQIPTDMTEEQARNFWFSHEITEEYLEKAGPVPEDQLPRFRPRTGPVLVRLDEDIKEFASWRDFPGVVVRLAGKRFPLSEDAEAFEDSAEADVTYLGLEHEEKLGNALPY